MPARGFVFSTDPPPEALAYFRNKGLRPSFNWQDVWAQEHAFAFTVAKATQLEVLLTIRKAVDDALAKGLTFDDFSKQLAPRLQGFGWWGRQFVVDPLTDQEIVAQLGSPQRLRLIYDANLRSAHAAGQWDRAQRTKAVLPFFLYVETRLQLQVLRAADHAGGSAKARLEARFETARMGDATVFEQTHRRRRRYSGGHRSWLALQSGQGAIFDARSAAVRQAR